MVVDGLPNFTEFGAREVAPRAELAYAAGTLDRESWAALADFGFWRLPLPPALGGRGLGWWAFADALEELARGTDDLGFVLSVIAHAGQVRAILEFGDAGQREALLPGLVSGEVGATALTEPHGGSDVARTRTTARRVPDGYVLSGTKDHVTNAPVADQFLVLGRLPELGRRDITLFLVPAAAPGCTRGDPEALLGLRSSPTGPVTFDRVHLQSTAVLGRPGEGLALLYNVISFDRLLYGLVVGAFLEPRLEAVLAYAEERTSFGQPIIEHQYVQGRLTDIRITIETTRAMARTALDSLLKGEPEASLRCSVAKLLGTERLAAAALDIVRVFGHAGYMQGPAAKTLQDSVGVLIAGGTSEMQRKNILNQMLRLRRAGG